MHNCKTADVSISLLGLTLKVNNCVFLNFGCKQHERYVIV